MVVVGRSVGTFEPARVTVAIAQANSASAKANTIAPSQPAGTAAGTNGKGTSQLSASPASTATTHASGGRIMTLAVSVVSAMAERPNLTPLSRWGSQTTCRPGGKLRANGAFWHQPPAPAARQRAAAVHAGSGERRPT